MRHHKLFSRYLAGVCLLFARGVLVAQESHYAAPGMPTVKKLVRDGVQGWERTGEGRIYRVHKPDTSASSRESAAPERIAAFRSLALMDDARLGTVLKNVQNDTDETVRKEVTPLGAPDRSPGALARITGILESGSVGEKQTALAAVVSVEGSAAATVLKLWMEKLIEGAVPKEMQLDVLDAASKRPEKILKELVARYETTRPKDDVLGVERVALFGGDAVVGKKIFLERADVACVRCHQVNGEGGEAGPVLTGIGTRQPREYLLESILFPNRSIAKGFDNLIVTLKNGTAYAGLLKSETDAELVLNSPEDGLQKLKKADITSREKGLSAMPEEMTKVLTRQEVRNLIEFLGTLKD